MEGLGDGTPSVPVELAHFGAEGETAPNNNTSQRGEISNANIAAQNYFYRREFLYQKRLTNFDTK